LPRTLKITAWFIAFAALLAGAIYFDLAFHLRLIARELSPGQPARAQNQFPQVPVCRGCNVVLVMLDTFRADRLGLYSGGKSLTPHLDAIAAQGLVFPNAFSNAFYTTPSHVTLFTSLYPQTHQVVNRRLKVPRVRNSNLEVKSNPLPDKYLTLAQLLRRQGYQTLASAPQNFNHLEEALGLFRGFDIHHAPVFPRAVVREAGQSGFDLAKWRAFSANLKPPFFMFVHSYITHLPYVAEELQPAAAFPLAQKRILDAYHDSNLWNKKRNSEGAEFVPACGDLSDIKACSQHIGPDALSHSIGLFQLRTISRAIRDDRDGAQKNETLPMAYNANVRDLDDQIGKFWQEAAQLKNTIFIFVSDHGEELFEHGEGSHSSLYDHTIRIPLFMVGPGIPRGTNESMVSLVDLMPTILDLTGSAPATQAQGQSLMSGEPRPEIVFGFTLGMEFARTRQWKYLLNERGQHELYYLPLDPLEQKNLIHSRNWKVAQAKRELEKQMDLWKLSTALK